MLTVTLGANDYNVYADIEFADAYLEADPDADAWRAATDDQKGRALVSGTRVLNVQNWKGSPTDEDQTDAWPRTGIDDVDEDTIPDAIAQANALLASAVLNGVDIVNYTSTANLQKRIKAGSVEVENFRPVDVEGLPLPQLVWKLIRRFIVGQGVAGARSSGTDGCSITNDPFRHSSPL